MLIRNKHIPLPGLRNIKTALTVLVLLMLYQSFGRENEFIAITAGILCLQDSVDKSLDEGMSRVVSTIIGGAYGLLFVFIGLNQHVILKDVSIAISCIIIIYVCNLISKTKYIINSVFVFILVVLVPVDEISPMIYAINRIIDTLVGIIVAVSINRYFFPPKLKHVHYKRAVDTLTQLKKDCKYIKAENYKKSTWSGGDALEIYIHPKDSLYEDFDFRYRISIADTKGDVNLTHIPNYYRRTMILKGETTFEHEGSHVVKLKQFEQDYFSGSAVTKAKGAIEYFNIIFARGYQSDITPIKNNETADLITITGDDFGTFNLSHYYSLYDNNVFTIKKSDETVFTHILNKGDSLIFKHLHHYSLDELIVQVGNSAINSHNEIVCIKASVT